MLIISGEGEIIIGTLIQSTVYLQSFSIRFNHSHNYCQPQACAVFASRWSSGQLLKFFKHKLFILIRSAKPLIFD